jgi:hypothetical protein
MGDVWQQFLLLYPAELQCKAESADKQQTCSPDSQEQQQKWQQQLLADR